MAGAAKDGDDLVQVAFDNQVAWVTLNRPEKRNAMNPALNARMLAVLEALEGDARCGVLVLTGAGNSFSAGMDLKEYFREAEGESRARVLKVRRDAYGWWRRLMWFEKPTIAMVNGWCFGGAFTPLVSCDLAIAAEDAQFGLSEINWGIIPAGNVTKAVAATMGLREALYYIMTGEVFDGRKAASLGLVERGGAARRAAGTRARDRRPPAGKESDGAESGEGCAQARARDAVGAGRGIPDRQAGTALLRRQDGGAKAGYEAVPGRQEFQARPGGL